MDTAKCIILATSISSDVRLDVIRSRSNEKIALTTRAVTLIVLLHVFDFPIITSIKLTNFGEPVARSETIRVFKMKKRAHRSEPDQYFITSNTDRD